MSRVAALALAWLFLAAPSLTVGLHAQTRPPAPAPTPPPAVEPVAPYEPQLLRLAEIMGSLAYLRDLCGDRDGDKWRARMASLMEAETGGAARKERLAGAYNRGFRGFETTYRVCTANARVVIERYIDEGGRLARDVGSRFGGG